MKNKRIILIGGAPTTGKSTIAELVAKHFDLPWISTDQMRKIMRRVASRVDHPKLFNPEGYDAKRFLTELSAEQIVRIEFDQAEAVWIGARAFIKEDWMWTNGFVVEGVNIVPHLVAKDFKNDKQLKAVFLVDEDVDRIRQVIYNRGLWGDARDYPDDVKEKEVEWVALFRDRIKAEAAKFGFPVVEVRKNGDDLRAVLAALAP